MKEKSSVAGLKNLTYCSCSAIDLSSNGIGRFILSAEESGEPSQMGRGYHYEISFITEK